MDGGFGDIKHDYRAAQLCSLTANMNRSKKQKPYKLEDFLMRPKENAALIMVQLSEILKCFQR